MQDAKSISLQIVAAVAEHEDVPPEELRPPIHDVINTDALDSLYQSGDSGRVPPRVEFVYKGHTVVVDSTGDVTVGDRASVSEPAKPTA